MIFYFFECSTREQESEEELAILGRAFVFVCILLLSMEFSEFLSTSLEKSIAFNLWKSLEMNASIVL